MSQSRAMKHQAQSAATNSLIAIREDEEGSSRKIEKASTSPTSSDCSSSAPEAEESGGEWGEFFTSVEATSDSGSAPSSAISFCEEITVIECLHHREYSKKEFKATWYTEKEVERNKESSRKVISQMLINGKPANTQSCTRGLEHKTPTGAKQRLRNKAAGWSAVQWEQIYQWDNGISDVEAIADAYIEATAHCTEQAIHQGKEDRKVALQQESVSRSRSFQDLFKNKTGSFSRLPQLGRSQAFGAWTPAA
eukprot:scaffold12167_cov129-Cylindrotheca_fusiformis.AAC.4